jgi:multiple sugar transport system substrate-binding protein
MKNPASHLNTVGLIVQRHIAYGVLILLFCASLMTFYGCNKKPAQDITFAVGGAPADLDFWQELIADFGKQTGIRVDMLRQPIGTDLRRQGLVTSLKSSRTDPDVFLMDIAWLRQFAASGWLEPLDSYVRSKQLNLEAFFEKTVSLANKHEGRLVALPVYVDGGILYYRKDLLKNYGIDKPPQTWQQLVKQAQKVQTELRKTNPNFYGFLWQGAQYEGLVCNWLEFTGSNKGGIILQDKDITISTKENIKATQFMYDLIHTYKISPPNTFTEMREEEVRTFFQQGNALFERNWPYAWALHQGKDSAVKGKVAITALPHFDGGQSVSTLGGWHIGISKYSDAKQKSFQFIKFVLSYDTQKKLAINLGWNPGRKDVYTDADVVKKLPHFVSLRSVFENLRPRPNVPYYTLISEVLQRHISGVLSGKSNVTHALQEAEKETKKIIEKYKQK